MPFFYTPPPEPSAIQLVTSERILTADMFANFPANAANRGKYCRVSDMWGLIDGVYRCTFNGRIYYWEPTTQPQLLGSSIMTGSMTLQPLSTFPILEIGGNLPALTTWSITLGTENLCPGLVKEFRPSLTTLLGTLNVLGTGLGSTVALLLNSNKRFGSYDNGTAVVWRQLN
jgi:hypothetical protein